MFVIIGKTASGKDSVVDILCREYGFHKVISYNTRPMRKGEADGVTYHFISKEEFERKRREGFFIESEPYTSVGGTQWHGIAKSDIIGDGTEKAVLILTPSGLRKIRKLVDKPVNCIYLYSDDGTLRKHLKKRGDDEEEAERRILSDNKEFSGAHWLADRIIYNNDDRTLDDIAEQISRHFDTWMEIDRN